MHVSKDEFYTLRGDRTYQRWKVTARFNLDTGEGLLPCIRLRPPNNGTALYLTADELKKRYRRWSETHG